MRRIYINLLLTLFGIASLSASSYAHGPVKRQTEVQTGQARLFTADAATGEIVAIDLPDAKTLVRLSTPPFVITLAASSDLKHLFAMRGRDTDRDWVTVIDTGMDSDAGEVRPPYVARTLLGGATTTGGLHTGMMATIGGEDALYLEDSAELVVFQNNDFSGYDGVDVRRYKLAAPDHIHALDAGGNIYIGYLRKGFVQILNRESGEEVTRIPGCPILHGIASDPVTGRLFFGCASDMLVVGTRGEEANKEVGRIAYPGDQRVAAFRKGKDRVFWGYTEGTLPLLYRLDLGMEPYAFNTISVASSVQVNTSEDGAFLLALTRAGVLEVRDGGTGELLRTVEVGRSFAQDFHEHTDKAILPEIEALGARAFVSLPHEGKIAEVDLDAGEVLRYLEIGGEPTRLVLVPWPEKQE